MNWMKALDDAHRVDEVLVVVGDFIDTRSDVYWAGIPVDLRRDSIASEDELQRWHHGLVRAIKDMPSPGTPMQELCVFSLRAAVRVHQIRLKKEPGDSSNERDFSAAAGRRSKR